MYLYNATETDLHRALDRANERYEGNLTLNIAGRRGNALSFRLGVRSSRGRGGKVGRNGRHIAAACWHAHRDFMLALFDLAPEARLKTAVADYRGKAGFAAKFEATGRRNIGSMMEPIEYREACECYDAAPDHKTTFGTLTPHGLVDVRTIKQSDLLACPFVILVPSHYRADGSCRCDDRFHAEMKEWGYRWNGKRWSAGETLAHNLR
jgi:hypothetical protein